VGIARVVFAVDGDTMVLLHGFAKKSRRTPVNDIDTSRRRLARLLEEER
jgi:phage-related protein